MISIQSPYSAEALVLEVDNPFVYSMRNDECRNVSNDEIGLWLNSHGEVRNVNVENLNELKESLALYADCRTALRLALYSTDKDLDNSLRVRAIRLLDPLLNKQSVYFWLQDLFCLQSLPEESVEIAKSSLNYAKNNDLAHYVSFYDNVLERQPVIHHVSAVWDLIEASSLFGSQHRDLMDCALGTGLFERIVSSGAKPELLDMALLVLLKLRPNIGSNITCKIFHAPIINKVVSNYFKILGMEDVVESMEHFGLWPLVHVGNKPSGKPKVSVRLKSTESPFNLGHHLELADLIITSGDSNDFISVSTSLVRHLDAWISQAQAVSSSILSGNTQSESLTSNDDAENSALCKVRAWADPPVTGACQPSHMVSLFQVAV